MKTANPVGWFEIYVDDMARAKPFYEAVLQTKLESLPMPEGMGNIEMLSFPMNPGGSGTTGALVKMEGMKAGANSVLVYFSCEDCAVEAGRVAAAGGQVMQEKMPIGQYGHMALAMDTEGNMFGLHSMG
jgi:uncharacterized protein